MSVPGVRDIGVVTLITDIGNLKNSSSGISLLIGLEQFRMYTNLQINYTIIESQKGNKITQMDSNTNCSGGSKKKKEVNRNHREYIK